MHGYSSIEEDFLRAVHGNSHQVADELIESVDEKIILEAMMICCQQKNQSGFDYLLPIISKLELKNNNNYYTPSRICHYLSIWNKDNLSAFLENREYLIDSKCIVDANDECFDYLLGVVKKNEVIINSFQEILVNGDVNRAKKMMEKTNCMKLQETNKEHKKHHVLSFGIGLASLYGKNKMVDFIISLNKLKPDDSNLIYSMLIFIEHNNKKGIDILFDKVNLNMVEEEIKEKDKKETWVTSQTEKIKEGKKYFYYLKDSKSTKEALQNMQINKNRKVKQKKI